jgi:peptidoglycan/LPS O-acetylase OafA/YrhL
MGQQPGLDGLRAVSVVAVVLYHAGFPWLHGGFLGVEVFFVVSGFLITTLLLEERETTGRVDLRDFWLRRARRLLPALALLLVVVGLWAALAGSQEQVSQLRRDLPWALGYLANWGQVVGAVPYFDAGDPPLLRHLWSLGVEEQWYLLWPLVFLGITRPGVRRRRAVGGLLVAAGAGALLMLVVQQTGPAPLALGPWEGVDRTNFNYLSTPTRSVGLLLGAAAAFVWRPWRLAVPTTRTARRRTERALTCALVVALGVLAWTFVVADLTAASTYPWMLTLVSIASTVAIAVVVHPGAPVARTALGWRPLVAVGRRSYGLYLWHWPVFVVLDATSADIGRVALATVVSIVLSEASYRLVEQPLRHGALGRWWQQRRQGGEPRWAPVAGATALVVLLGAWYVRVEPYDVAVGGPDVAFVLPAETTPGGPGASGAGPDTTTPRGGESVGAPTRTRDGTLVPGPAANARPSDAGSAPPASDVGTPTTSSVPASGPSATSPEEPPPSPSADLPVVVAVVGDSQARSLALNLPSGIEDTFTIVDGSLNGCSVHSAGRASSSRGVSTAFERCGDWLGTWSRAASRADVALVVLGAWDVLDLTLDGTEHVFGSGSFDAVLRRDLGRGLDAIAAAGAHAALLEVACMRPQDVEGAGVPALPERGDDARVDHLNALFREVAAARPGAVTFVEGPDAWCDDEAVSRDLAHRWDGVHVYRPGADLIYRTIAADLLRLAA